MSRNAIEIVEIQGNRYVPLKEALTQIGGNVDWNNELKQATVISGGRTAVINMADENVLLDGQTHRLSLPPLVKEETLYVPEDFFDRVLQQQIYIA